MRMFRSQLHKTRHDLETSSLEDRNNQVYGVSQKSQHLRIIYSIRCYFQIGNPSGFLVFKQHDVFQVYEAIFIAARDYTNARMQATVEDPEDIVRAYNAVLSICALLSADRLDKADARTLRRKLIKHVRILVFSELMHLLPRMFTQVALLANGSGKLKRASLESLQRAGAVANKIPRWPPRHPLRRILSNLVILGHSEDPSIVSQVAKNARKCVLETCNNREFRSTAYSDGPGPPHFMVDAKRDQDVLLLGNQYQVHTEKSGRVWKANEKQFSHSSRPSKSKPARGNPRGESNSRLQRNDESQRIVRQLDKSLVQNSISDSRGKNRHAEPYKQGQLNIAANHVRVATAGVVPEHNRADSLMDSLPEDNVDRESLPTQRGERVASDQTKDSPCYCSPENAVLVFRGKGDEMGILDRFRFYIEQISGEELDWRPLPPINHPRGLCESRICWTVSTSLS